jgi:hypothetical protein
LHLPALAIAFGMRIVGEQSHQQRHDIIDMTSSSKVVRLASPSGLRFEDDPKARAGRLGEALQRISRGSYFATFDTRDVGL